MSDLEDLIRYENENSRLDFKATQYQKEQRHDIIKDVLSMANAHESYEGLKYIILGVKHYPDGSRNLVGIPNGEFLDSAIYQQIIKENIEPDLDIEYFPFKLDNQIFGILSIAAPDRPYLLRKDMDRLKKGACLIRKGSATYPMSRADLDRIYNQKFTLNKRRFEGKIKIGFAGTDFEKILELRSKDERELNLRSQREGKKIKEILEEKIASKTRREEERKQNPNYKPGTVMLPDPEDIEGPSYLGGLPYEQRAICTLESNLKNVKEIYRGDDFYELAEIHSFGINLTICNEGNEYLEDAYIQLRIHNPYNSIYIFPKIVKKPEDKIASIIRHNQSSKLPDINEHYPEVSYRDNSKLIIVKESVGDIRHHIDTLAFQEWLRIYPIFKIDKPIDIEVECKVGGKNLSTPVEENLVIRLIPATVQKGNRT
jgi:hypothetical protein